jgi:hypothetical protein
VSEALARWIVAVAGGYLAAGLVFALAFAVRGVERVDPSARGTGWGFRALIVPGAAALWPWLAVRWARGAAPATERNAHRDAAARGSAS